VMDAINGESDWGENGELICHFVPFLVEFSGDGKAENG
jgi:hypothetical protein